MSIRDYLAGDSPAGPDMGILSRMGFQPGMPRVRNFLRDNRAALTGAGLAMLTARTQRQGYEGLQAALNSGRQTDAYRNKLRSDEQLQAKREQALATVMASLQESGKLPAGMEALAALPEVAAPILVDALKPRDPVETWEPTTMNGMPGQRNTVTGKFDPFSTAQPPETWRPLSPQDRAAYNIPTTDTRPWQISSNGDLRLPGQPQTQVSIDQRGNTAWETESAKLFAKRYDDIQTQAAAATDMMGMYDLAADALSTGIYTGIGGDQMQSLRRIGAALGVDNAESVAAGELVTSLQNRMALIMRSPDAGMGMPGAVSDKDITFLKQAQIGLDRSPEGNKRMIAAFRRLEQRKIEIAQLADQYITRNGRLDAGFFEEVRRYAAANPLFAESAGAAESNGNSDLYERYGLEPPGGR